MITNYRQFLEAAVVIIENDNDQILLLDRNFEPFGWCLPGGKIEIDENQYDAAIRETREETNLIVRNLIYIGKDKSVTGRPIHIYYTKTFKGELKITPEHKNFEWVNKNQITKNLAGRTMDFIEHCYNKLNSEERKD